MTKIVFKNVQNLNSNNSFASSSNNRFSGAPYGQNIRYVAQTQATPTNKGYTTYQNRNSSANNLPMHTPAESQKNKPNLILSQNSSKKNIKPVKKHTIESNIRPKDIVCFFVLATIITLMVICLSSFKFAHVKSIFSEAIHLRFQSAWVSFAFMFGVIGNVNKIYIWFGMTLLTTMTWAIVFRNDMYIWRIIFLILFFIACVPYIPIFIIVQIFVRHRHNLNESLDQAAKAEYKYNNDPAFRAGVILSVSERNRKINTYGNPYGPD